MSPAPYFDPNIADMHLGLESLPDGEMTNVAYILARPSRPCSDESGKHPGESFVEICLTRTEVRQLLASLDADWADTIRICGDPKTGKT